MQLAPTTLLTSRFGVGRKWGTSGASRRQEDGVSLELLVQWEFAADGGAVVPAATVRCALAPTAISPLVAAVHSASHALLMLDIDGRSGKVLFPNRGESLPDNSTSVLKLGHEGAGHDFPSA